MDDLQIQNMALAHLSVEPITDIDEGTTQADVLKRFYQPAVEAAITRTRWKFARTVSSTLAQDPSDSDDEYSRWRLPSDRLWVMGFRNQVGQELDCRIEGDLATVIGAEPTAVYCTYLRSAAAGSWPAYFAVALSYSLAGFCCIPLTEDGKLLETLSSLEQMKWDIAQSADAMQGGTESLMEEDEASMLSGR